MASTWRGIRALSQEETKTAAARVIGTNRRLAKARRGDEVNVDDLKKAERAIAFARECGQRGDFRRVILSLNEATALIARVMK